MIYSLDLTTINDMLMGSLPIILNQVNYCIDCINFKLNIIQTSELRMFYYDSIVLEAKHFANLNGYN